MNDQATLLPCAFGAGARAGVRYFVTGNQLEQNALPTIDPSDPNLIV
jgi:hypothetical protein